MDLGLLNLRRRVRGHLPRRVNVSPTVRGVLVLALAAALGLASTVGLQRHLDVNRERAEEWAPIPDRTFKTHQCHAATLPPQRIPPSGTVAGWTPPASPAMRLVEVDGTVTGAPPPPPAPLRQWARADLARWEPSVADGRERLTSPVVVPPLDTARRLVLTLRPGQSTGITLVASPRRTITTADRLKRSVWFPLGPPDTRPEMVTLTADVHRLYAEATEDPRSPLDALHRLEVAVDADGDRPVLESLALYGESAEYLDAAGTRLADLGGVLRPAWYARDGGAVAVEVTVPDAGAELRWHGGALDAAGGAIEVRLPTGSTTVAVVGSPDWTPQRVSLDPWAGQAVEVVLRSAGPGVTLFGDPRVVPRAEARAPNVLLYLADTVRADHVGAWGGTPGVTPTLDRLASEGATFALALSASPWTKPAAATLLTGLWPTHHGIGSRSYADVLPADVPRLQSAARAAGWRTGSFSASPLGSTLSGLEHGFAIAHTPVAWRSTRTPMGAAPAAALHAALLGWVDEEPDQPFFAFVHALEAGTWEAKTWEETAGDPAWTRYERALHGADAAFGDLLQSLDARGVLDDTLVVVVSDHGESFRDHGVYKHGTGLYQSQVHVPLILWAGDALGPLTYTGPVALADVAPTVLDLLGLDGLSDADGLSLAGVLRGEDPPARDGVPAARLRFVHRPQATPIFAWVAPDGEKLIRTGDREWAFRLADDLCETTTAPFVRRSTVRHLDAWLDDQRDASAAFDARHAPPLGALDADDAAFLAAHD